MKILIEATGSITSGYLIKAIKDAGHQVVGSDINDFNHASSLCNEFIIMPKSSDKLLWEKTYELLESHNIDIVIPSLDETLLGWAERINELNSKGVHVVLSPAKTIKTFRDKWLTYEFFVDNNINTPRTSMLPEFNLIKPRYGRGSQGLRLNPYENIDRLVDEISQEIIEGEEITVDVFFSNEHKPVYIIPRKRIDVKEGKSTKGIVFKNDEIENEIKKISEQTEFLGPVNFQLFITKDNKIVFIEINPRIAGGMALGFAASENWIDLIVNNIVKKEKIVNPKEIKYGLKMVRYYAECFI